MITNINVGPGWSEISVVFFLDRLHKKRIKITDIDGQYIRIWLDDSSGNFHFACHYKGETLDGKTCTGTYWATIDPYEILKFKAETGL